jgi:hypothetical protein
MEPMNSWWGALLTPYSEPVPATTDPQLDVQVVPPPDVAFSPVQRAGGGRAAARRLSRRHRHAQHGSPAPIPVERAIDRGAAAMVEPSQPVAPPIPAVVAPPGW